jgi:hemolysin D
MAAENSKALVATPSRVKISDHEFLPPAVEILVTPPSRVLSGLLLVMCAFAAAALLGCYFYRIEIVATAQGKFQPAGGVKVVQPLEPGRVVAFHVRSGEHVQEGDVLVEFDSGEAQAEVEGNAINLISYRAEALRRLNAIKAAQAKMISSAPQIAWDSGIPLPIRLREEKVIASDLGELNSQVSSFNAQADQKTAEHERLEAMITSQKRLIATLNERVQTRSSLVRMNAGSRTDVLDAQEKLQYQTVSLAQQMGQLVEAEANLAVIARDTQKAYEKFISDNAQKLADAERKADDFEQKLAISRAKLSHMTLRAPVAGTIQASSMTTVGQVVRSGEEIMRIVPENAPLQIECYLPNEDMGFVKEGQEAIVKVESFPFTRYGTITARVTRVAQDAIPESDAKQIESDSAKSTKSISSGEAQRTQNLVFPVTLAPEATVIDADGTPVAFTPGMAAKVEIKTGSRRMLEYIFSPLVQTRSLN